MDFGKELIEKVEGIVEDSFLVEVDGQKFSARNLNLVKFEPKIAATKVATLTGFVDFIDANIDEQPIESEYIAVVEGYENVILKSRANKIYKDRTYLLEARLDQDMEEFPFGEFLKQEDFLIKLHSLFEKKDGDDFDYVSSTISKVTQADSAVTEDDGITQRVTVKRGVSGALTEKDTVKHIVKLSPFRTFREVEQVESQFLLRIDATDGRVRVALFEADGGAWRNEARLRIAEYLKENISCPVIA